MNLFLIILSVFLASASLVVTLIFLATAMQTSPQARIRKRFGTLVANPTASQRELRGLLKDPAYSDIPWLHSALDGRDFIRKTALLLERANLDINPSIFLMLSAVIGAAI